LAFSPAPIRRLAFPAAAFLPYGEERPSLFPFPEAGSYWAAG
jgi:hypothetical protein